MGSSLCIQDSQNSRSEINLLSKKQYKLNGPPHIFKPTPIMNILTFDEQIEKEESPQIENKSQLNSIQNERQLSYVPQQSEEIESTQQKPWIKKTYAIQTANASNLKNDENNNKNNNSLKKNSSKEIIISTGKNKNVKEAFSISPQKIQQDSNMNINFDKKFNQKGQNRNK